MRMNTKTLATIAVFSAVTISLNPISIPAPFLPNFPYRFWDIPIIVAFFLFGFKVALSIAALNGVGQLLLFPRPIGVVAPIWFFIAILTLLLGLYSVTKLLNRRILTSYLVLIIKR
jgi:riboflavin transporter FmnP